MSDWESFLGELREEGVSRGEYLFTMDAERAKSKLELNLQEFPERFVLDWMRLCYVMGVGGCRWSLHQDGSGLTVEVFGGDSWDRIYQLWSEKEGFSADAVEDKVRWYWIRTWQQVMACATDASWLWIAKDASHCGMNLVEERPPLLRDLSDRWHEEAKACLILRFQSDFWKSSKSNCLSYLLSYASFSPVRLLLEKEGFRPWSLWYWLHSLQGQLSSRAPWPISWLGVGLEPFEGEGGTMLCQYEGEQTRPFAKKRHANWMQQFSLKQGSWWTPLLSLRQDRSFLGMEMPEMGGWGLQGVVKSLLVDVGEDQDARVYERELQSLVALSLNREDPSTIQVVVDGVLSDPMRWEAPLGGVCAVVWGQGLLLDLDQRLPIDNQALKAKKKEVEESLGNWVERWVSKKTLPRWKEYGSFIERSSSTVGDLGLSLDPIEGLSKR